MRKRKQIHHIVRGWTSKVVLYTRVGADIVRCESDGVLERISSKGDI